MLVFEFKGLFLIHGGKSDFTKKNHVKECQDFNRKYGKNQTVLSWYWLEETASSPQLLSILTQTRWTSKVHLHILLLMYWIHQLNLTPIGVPCIISLNFQSFTINKQTTPWYERESIISPVDPITTMLTICNLEAETIFFVIHVAIVVGKPSSYPIEKI